MRSDTLFLDGDVVVITAGIGRAAAERGARDMMENRPAPSRRHQDRKARFDAFARETGA